MESVLGQELEGLGSRSPVNLGSWLFSGSVTSEKSFIPVSLGLLEGAIMSCTHHDRMRSCVIQRRLGKGLSEPVYEVTAFDQAGC